MPTLRGKDISREVSIGKRTVVSSPGGTMIKSMEKGRRRIKISKEA